MPISLVHVIEVNHQSISDFNIHHDTTALIANHIRLVTKPKIDSFYDLSEDIKTIMGTTEQEKATNKEKAVLFSQKNNINVDFTDYNYSFQSFDIVVTLSDNVKSRFKFLTIEDAERAYIELLTAASLSQVEHEKTKGQ